MDTARRSSRAARSSQPLQSNPHHSSASSNSSGRAERATRSNPKADSPTKSTPSGSLSSEPPDDAIATPAEDSVQTRRKRGRGDDKDKAAKPSTTQIESTNGIEENADDDEAVRCICGFDEYPGPPQLGEEDSKQGIKDGIEEPIISVADITEDGAGFFLQCDVCKVWQHGYCVGIMNEDMSPDEYFCEECRKDLHKIFAAPNGIRSLSAPCEQVAQIGSHKAVCNESHQVTTMNTIFNQNKPGKSANMMGRRQRYSHYLPLYQSLSQTTSRANSFSKDGTKSPRGSKSGRPSSSLQSAKRRSTMNSRDAAYDEEEQLRRAIEASKGEKSGESTDGGTVITTTRREKRGRSDSEEKPEGPKRQRTLSPSPSPVQEPQQTPQAESDDGINGRPIGAKKIRGAAARNHREKEMREEREKSRQEAANKRKGRAERRRIEGRRSMLVPEDIRLPFETVDSEPSEDIPLAAVRATITKVPEVVPEPIEPPVVLEPPVPDTPPPAVQPPTSHRKGGRPPNSRKGKLGKNQYTKDRDLQEGDNHSPQRSQSRDVPRGDETPQTSGNKGSHNEGGGKSAKSKSANSKISMGDMRKRVTAILDYISRIQVEMAGESMSPGSAEAAETTIRGIADGLPMIKVNRDSKANGDIKVNGNANSITEGDESSKKEFKDLSCLEMMDVLTRQLVKWQNQHT
ncbi:hypothetical protein HYFRA_00001974 [Hymenoscyphus fraxineus]|uniref:Zinc finger PHD-type domain-containing protein n=1 Tax=Hymenoscyphus fraxineus TaxID=746836 RepID=A0A9N9KKZ2_9HELO|nr:hypothetical protein HYFRA_00001974 [Hymenoscyphus fraxineus]